MRWSLEELRNAIRLYRKPTFLKRLVYFPLYFIKGIRIFFFWLFNGYCKQSFYSLDRELLDILSIRLKLFKKYNKQSYPTRFSSIEEWHKELQLLINSVDLLRESIEDSVGSYELNTKYTMFITLLQKNFLDLCD